VFRRHKKFIALLLAVWLPLFSGYALADSVVMQNMRGGCHVGQQITHSMQHNSASRLYMQAVHGQQANGLHHGHPPICNDNCGLCQLACSGYFSAQATGIAEFESSSQVFSIVSTEFQSVTIALLDPPPLARV
jgi:hypothetical protein